MPAHIATQSIGSVVASIASVLLIVATGVHAGPPRYPDIVEQISHLQVQNEHRREMLRFSTTHINVGDGPLQVRGGDQIAPCVIDTVAYAQCTHSTQEVLDAAGNIVETYPAGVAVFHPEHNHWHQSNVALFQIRVGALNGPVWSAGDKITFCLIDNDQTVLVKKGSSRAYFDCNRELQGISVGWSDNYHQSTEGQELDHWRAGGNLLPHSCGGSGKPMARKKRAQQLCLGEVLFEAAGGESKGHRPGAIDVHSRHLRHPF